MKKILTLIVALLMVVTNVAQAAPTSWDYSNNVLQPLQTMRAKEVRLPWVIATSTTATSTFWRASTTVFCLGSDCRIAWPTGSGSVATGTTGQIPWYSATGTTLTASSSLYLASNGFIGLGTSTPLTKFFIEGYDPGNGYTVSSIRNAASDGRAELALSAGTQPYYTGFVTMSGPTVANYPNTMEIGCGLPGCGLNMWSDGFLQARMATSGNLGLGTTTNLTSKLTLQSIFGGQPMLTVASTTGASLYTITDRGFLGIGTTTPSSPIVVALADDPAMQLGDNSGGLGYFVIQPNSATSGRAMFGYQPTGAGYTTVQGGTGKGIQFNVNTNVFGAGVAATIDSSGRFSIGTTSIVGLLNVATSTPATVLLNMSSTATSTAIVDSVSATQGSCLKLKDSDGAGYTYITVNNGVLTASATSCQ